MIYFIKSAYWSRFVPITQVLREKAMKQLDKKSNEYRKERIACT